eukprot:19642_1
MLRLYWHRCSTKPNGKKRGYILKCLIVKNSLEGMFTVHVSSEEHVMQLLLSLLAYCNFDSLQNEFSKTYRKLSDDESDDDLVKRHSEFYFMGKYMVEAVHYFGDTVILQTNWNKPSDTHLSSEFRAKFRSFDPRYYHGIKEELIFSSVLHFRSRAPLSTSAKYQVGLQFTGDNGLLLVLRPACIVQNCPVYWLSDYPNEREHIFFGSEYYGPPCEITIDEMIQISSGFQMQPLIQSIHFVENMFDFGI